MWPGHHWSGPPHSYSSAFSSLPYRSSHPPPVPSHNTHYPYPSYSQHSAWSQTPLTQSAQADETSQQDEGQQDEGWKKVAAPVEEEEQMELADDAELSVDLNDPDAWDDSALIEAYEQAVQEYMRGGGNKRTREGTGKSTSTKRRRKQNVETTKSLSKENHTLTAIADATDASSARTKALTPPSVGASNPPSFVPTSVHSTSTTTAPTSHMEGIASSSHAHTEHTPTPSSLPAPAHLPLPDDEELSQLLMAWYYAGYWTGRHQSETQQLAAPHSMKDPPAYLHPSHPPSYPSNHAAYPSHSYPYTPSYPLPYPSPYLAPAAPTSHSSYISAQPTGQLPHYTSAGQPSAHAPTCPHAYYPYKF